MSKLASFAAAGVLGRRSFLRQAACAGLAAAAAPALDLIAAPAEASNWRGLVGCVKPRANDPVIAEMIRLLPPGVGVAVAYLNFTEGSNEEMQRSLPNYEKNIAYLASQKCDLISVEGAPPFMMLGPEGETKLVDGWKEKYKTDMFTSSQNQVNAFRALKAKKILGITSGSGGPEMERVYAKYFEDSGFSVVAMQGMGGVEFSAVQDVPPEKISAFIKKTFNEHKGADAVYILGSSLEAIRLIEPLERELGVPVVQAIAARIWEIQKRLKVHEPIRGYGRLLETLPA